MKKFIAALMAMLVTLVACAGFDKLSTFGSNPTVRAATGVKGQPVPTRKDVLATGKPARIFEQHDVSCYEYRLDKAGKSTPFYVVFDRNDKVGAYGFTDCSEAMANGIF